MHLPYLLLDIDGVLIPFPAADGTTPPTHVHHTVLPTGRPPDKPVDVWLDPNHGDVLTALLASGLITPVWCTSWREDATTIIGALLGLPRFPHLDLPRARITTSHPDGYLWKRDYVDRWLGSAPQSGSMTTSPLSTTPGPPSVPLTARPPCSSSPTRTTAFS